MKNHKNNDISAFFALVRAGLWEKEAGLLPFDGVDLSRVYKLAQEQSVVGLVAAGLEHVRDVKVPQDTALSFAGSILRIEDRNKAMNALVAELMGRLRAAGVKALLVKGQGIAQCYERPLWRASGDIDFLLDSDNYPKAVKYLSSIAQKTDGENSYKKHQSFVIDSRKVECHGTLRSNLWRRLDKGIDAVQADTFMKESVRMWRNGETDVFIPAADNDVVIVFCHILQHFFRGGIGLRQICDWCRLLWTFRGLLDCSLLEQRLRSMGAFSEWRAFAALAVDYLGMPTEAMPLYSSATCWSWKASRVLRIVFMTGNMGHNRDMSYRADSCAVRRKVCTFGHITIDAIRQFIIFPLDSWRVWWRMMMVGWSSISSVGI